MSSNSAPEWLKALREHGFRPYIASSRKLLPHLNLRPFGQDDVELFLMDEIDHSPFLEAYLLSNSLSFESPSLKMPHWVLIDAVLMQSAVVGFTLPIDMVSEELLRHYRHDENIDFAKLNRLPVSGQISATNIGGESMTGISLFSLGRHLKNAGKLGLFTKMMALEVYRARDYETYYGIAQYDNPSLRIHGYFTNEMEIHQPIVLLHPRKEMTMIYKMRLQYDPYNVEKLQGKAEPSFWLDAADTDKKRAMQDGIRQGKRYIIAPPISVQRDESVYLPIIEKEPSL